MLPVQAQNDAQAKNLLDEVQSQYESYSSINLTFTYKLSNRREGINQRAEGTLMAAGDQYKLDVMGVRQIFDGTMLYTIIDENQEVMIQEGAVAYIRQMLERNGVRNRRPFSSLCGQYVKIGTDFLSLH